jgi:hypothetical protein
MFRDPKLGPRSDLASYAYGWSDKKPSVGFWVIIGAMFAYVVYRFATL